MVSLEIDVSAFERMAVAMDGAVDQVPFALSRSLNAGVTAARTRLVDQTWPQHVTARDRRFLTAALRVKYSTKHDLEVVYYDVLKRGQLERHADGGRKRPNSGSLAIPIDPIVKKNRGAGGVHNRYKPSMLQRSYRIGPYIFQRVGKGKNSRSRLMYVLKASAFIPKRVPFREHFAETVLRVTYETFPEEFAKAMRKRRPR